MVIRDWRISPSQKGSEESKRRVVVKAGPLTYRLSGPRLGDGARAEHFNEAFTLGKKLVVSHYRDAGQSTI